MLQKQATLINDIVASVVDYLRLNFIIEKKDLCKRVEVVTLGLLRKNNVHDAAPIFSTGTISTLRGILVFPILVKRFVVSMTRV